MATSAAFAALGAAVASLVALIDLIEAVLPAGPTGATDTVAVSGVLLSPRIVGSVSIASDRPKRSTPGLLMACGLRFDAALFWAGGGRRGKASGRWNSCTAIICTVFCTAPKTMFCTGQCALASHNKPMCAATTSSATLGSRRSLGNGSGLSTMVVMARHPAQVQAQGHQRQRSAASNRWY